MPKESPELKIVHERIEGDLKLIKDTLIKIDEKFGIQNGKVARAENGIIELTHTTSDLLKSITADAERIKKLEDKNQKEIDEEINALRKKDVTWRERFSWGVVITIVFILGVLGIIQTDFIKLFI